MPGFERLSTKCDRCLLIEVNSKTGGKRQLGALIGCKGYKAGIVMEKKTCIEWSNLNNRKGSTTRSPCYLYEGVQIQIYILHANNRVIRRLQLL